MNFFIVVFVVFIIMKNVFIYFIGKLRLKMLVSIYWKLGEWLIFKFLRNKCVDEVNKKIKRVILIIFFKN